MVSRRLSRAAALAYAALLLLAGLMPFGFSPLNRVSRVPGEGGLRFDGTRLPWRVSVGGLAYTESLRSGGRAEAPAAGAFTILLRLRPERERGGSVPRILALAEPAGGEVLYLAQYRQNLIVGWRKAGGSAKQFDDFNVPLAFFKGQARWLAVTSDSREIAVYLDGRKARIYPGAVQAADEGVLRGRRLVLGNTPQAYGPWTGDVLDLALYERAMGESEIFEIWRVSPDGFHDRPTAEGLLAAYGFEGPDIGRTTDLSGNGNDLASPPRILVRHKPLGPPDFAFHDLASLARDIVENIIGFMPVGFLFLLWLDDRRRWPRAHSYVIVVMLGTFLSLAIEFTQAYIPARDSSMADFVCNVLGTALGVLSYHLYLRFVAKPAEN